jgi:hypothetical protein
MKEKTCGAPGGGEAERSSWMSVGKVGREEEGTGACTAKRVAGGCCVRHAACVLISATSVRAAPSTGEHEGVQGLVGAAQPLVLERHRGGRHPHGLAGHQPRLLHHETVVLLAACKVIPPQGAQFPVQRSSLARQYDRAGGRRHKVGAINPAATSTTQRVGVCCSL